MKNGEVNIMFQENKSIIQEYSVLRNTPIGGGLTFYIKVRDIKKMYDQLKDKVKLIIPMHTTFYGVDKFAIQDINGFVLTFANCDSE